MRTFRLALRPTDGPVRPATAWFLPGPDPAAWLDALGGWTDATFFVLGAAIDDPTPIGALVPIPSGRRRPRPGGRALPYGSIGRLHLPVEAVLEPDVGAAELDRVLSDDLLVLHPTAGLVGFAITDARTAADLIEAPSASPSVWTATVEGPPPRPPLESIEPEVPPRLEAVFGEAADAIGSRPADAMPGQAGLGQAIGRFLRRLTGAEEDRRRQELDRLLALLDEDPDEGLRFALPLGPSDGHRGLAPPGHRLGRRPIEFDLARLGGGGPADPWAVEIERERLLRERYRNLAARETNLGRHRRAAYIYAHLLGDIEAAAGALEAGRHHREAAVLYRDRLDRPLAAAACLERGGLLAEACRLYEDEGEDERAGDLHRRLERHDLADRAYRRAVETCRRRGDDLAAAGLLEKKVEATEEALALLESTWPDGPQARACLEERFHLLARLGRHEQALHAARILPDDEASAGRAVELAGVLGTLGQTYPDRRVRQLAADGARRVVGLRLRDAGPDRRRELLLALEPAGRFDRLLGRDLRRYGQSGPQPVRRPAAGGGSAVRATFDLPSSVDWTGVRAVDDLIYAAGHGPAGPAVARCRATGTSQVLHWQVRGSDRATLLLAPDPGGAHPTIVHPALGRPLPLSPFPARDGFAGPVEAGSLPWLSEVVRAVAYGAGGTVWTLAPLGERLVLTARSVAGHVQRTDDGLDLPGETSDRPLVESIDSPSSVFVALGRRLVSRGACAGGVGFPRPVHDLATGRTPSGAMVAVGLEEGAMVLWAGPGWWQGMQPIAEDLIRPRLVVLGDGRLVAVDRTEGRIYSTEGRRLVCRSTFAGPGKRIVGLLATGHRSEFAVVTVDRRVRLLRAT